MVALSKSILTQEVFTWTYFSLILKSYIISERLKHVRQSNMFPANVNNTLFQDGSLQEKSKPRTFSTKVILVVCLDPHNFPVLSSGLLYRL